MGRKINPDELRAMLRLARQLREAADSTTEPDYVELFLRGAVALEERASHLAGGETDALQAQSDAALHRPINLIC